MQDQLNSVFSLSRTSRHTKVKEPILPYYLSITGKRIVPKGIISGM